MDIEIIKSRRKSIAIEIKTDLKVIVRAPFYISNKKIEDFILSRMGWIEKHIAKIREQNGNVQDKLTNEEIMQLRNKTGNIIWEKVEYYARIMGVKYNRITIKKMFTRWGSCSEKGNVNFNMLLSLCPEEVIDYVVVHELSHLKEMNHSKEFWSIVESYCPEYMMHKKWLKDNANKLIARL